MNTLSQQLLETFETLPHALQQEALHYVDYLKTSAAQRTEAMDKIPNQSGSLVAAIRRHVDAVGGIELAIPPREAMKQPLDFGL